MRRISWAKLGEPEGDSRQLREQRYTRRGKTREGTITTYLEPPELLVQDERWGRLGLQRGSQPQVIVIGGLTRPSLP